MSLGLLCGRNPLAYYRTLVHEGGMRLRRFTHWCITAHRKVQLTENLLNSLLVYWHGLLQCGSLAIPTLSVDVVIFMVRTTRKPTFLLPATLCGNFFGFTGKSVIPISIIYIRLLDQVFPLDFIQRYRPGRIGSDSPFITTTNTAWHYAGATEGT